MARLTSVERWKRLVVMAKLSGTYSRIDHSQREYLQDCCDGKQPWLRAVPITEERSFWSWSKYLQVEDHD